MSRMLKIWGRTNSGNVRKVVWMAEELGLSYDQIIVGGKHGGLDDAYRSMNPTGLIPTIQDGDYVLWESNTIVRYLAAKHAGGTHWYPTSLEARASQEKWMDWAASSFFPAMKPAFWGILRTPPPEQDWDKIAAAIKNASKQLQIAEDTLARQAYLSGDEIGVGDIPLGAAVYIWFEMPVPKELDIRDRTPNVRKWYGRLRERGAYQKGVMTEVS